MSVDFQKLESELSETEMAFLIAVDTSMNASMLAGADPSLTIQHLEQHANNFAVRGQDRASLIFQALAFLRKNAAGM